MKNKRHASHRLRTFVSILSLLLFTASGIYAQTAIVTGKVTDSSGQPVIGANVTVLGTYTGVATGLDGDFSLNVEPGQQLEITYLGMQPQKVTVGSEPLNIVLQEESLTLDAAVVIGYGSAKKRDLTGSIANVKGEDIANRPSSNPMASLQGKVAGVQIVNSGRAGQDPEIRIRGTNSINGYAPLYVVDGLFTDNINFLNASDIESFEILKDPSSLAIFGVRGANGVIIVTTKRAKAGQTLVNVSQNFGIKHVGKRVDMVNAEQFRELYDEQLRNMKANPFNYAHYGADTNWQDAIFRTAYLSQTNASVTGSTDKNKFYLGVGYTYEQGNIRFEEMQKMTVNFSSDYTAKPWLRFGVQMNGAYMIPSDAKDPTDAVRAAPISPIYGPNNSYYALPDFQRAQMANPMLAIENEAQHNIAQNYRLSGGIYGEVDFIPQLTFRAAFALDYLSNNSRRFSPVRSHYYPENDAVHNISNIENITQTKGNTMTAQSDYVLTYKDTFAQKHNLTLTGGMTTNYVSAEAVELGRSQDVTKADMPIPNDPDKWWVSSIGDTSSATNKGTQYRRFTLSYLFRALYNYDNRYLLNASFRRDGASVFRYTGNTWDNFYSVGAGWVLSEEGFMRNQHVVDYLKFKGSYGVLGNQNTGSTGGMYPAFPTLSSTNAVFGDMITGSFAPAYLVTNLRWEKTSAWEVGMEMQMLRNRLRLEPVYYSKTTNDLICYLEKFMGAQDGLTNAGSIRNSGWELTASWNDRIGKDFEYTLSANLTTINNKVLDLGKTYYQGDRNVAVSQAGMPIGYFYGYVMDGIYQSTNDIQNSPNNTLATVAPGDLKFKDISGPNGVPDGKIDDRDRTMIGNPTPDFTYGYALNMRYKNFDLGIEFQGVSGNEIYNTGSTSTYTLFNYHSKRMDRWRGEGTSNREPILDSSRALQQLNSSYYIEDGSYLRLRNIQLGYNLGERVARKLRLQALRVFVNVDNLKTWSNNTGFTPEIGGSALAFGIDNGTTYPMPTTYTFGINATF